MSSLQTILEEKCAILLKEREIFFAGLINKSGKLLAGGLKSRINLADEFEREKLFMEHVLMVSMSRDFDHCLGRLRYIAAKREKTIMMSFSIGSFLFLVVIDPKEDVEKEASKIEKIIKNFVSYA
ncbi:hypothetical protein C4565_07315 [Candidatus Parcubacteria bacterium]|nr:MAG: hypothetical protein C4565_07315 [Candidatus Parcubacteria bacterium]